MPSCCIRMTLLCLNKNVIIISKNLRDKCFLSVAFISKIKFRSFFIKIILKRSAWSSVCWFDCVLTCNHIITVTSCERYGVSNHRQNNGLFNGVFRLTSKKTSHLYFTGLCEENSPMIGGFPSQRVNIAVNVSMSLYLFLDFKNIHHYQTAVNLYGIVTSKLWIW